MGAGGIGAASPSTAGDGVGDSIEFIEPPSVQLAQPPTATSQLGSQQLFFSQQLFLQPWCLWPQPQ